MWLSQHRQQSLTAGSSWALEQELQGTYTALHLSYGLLPACFNYRTLNIDNTLSFLPLKLVLFQTPWKTSWKSPAKLCCSNGKRDLPIFLPKLTQGQLIHTFLCQYYSLLEEVFSPAGSLSTMHCTQ